MKYDFTTYPDRHGRDAIALDNIGHGGPGGATNGMDNIPMWIADMHFATAPSILEAIEKRLAHPLFGYFAPTEEYFRKIIRWQTAHNGAKGLAAENIGYENGVLGGVITALGCLAEPGAAVLLHAPTYVGFTRSLTENGYKIVLSELVPDESGLMRMDYADMEKKIKENDVKVAIVCNPHNPTGRVWEKWELEKAMEVYERCGVWVISDEIWSDIILNGNKHVPTQSANEYARNHTVAFYALTKTFNLAGFASAYHIIYNKELCEKVTERGHATEYNSMNVLSMHALLGGYTPEGEEWLAELREVLSANVNLFCDYFAKHFPDVRIVKPQGTYMLFPDFTEWCAKRGKTLDEVMEAGWATGVCWQDGRPFHGACSLRVNVALPTAKLEEALHRLDAVLK